MLAYHSETVEEIDERTTVSDDDSSFLSDGGESGLEEVRSLVWQGKMRRYRALGDIGCADINDAASKEDRPLRKSPPEESTRSSEGSAPGLTMETQRLQGWGRRLTTHPWVVS